MGKKNETMIGGVLHRDGPDGVPLPYTPKQLSKRLIAAENKAAKLTFGIEEAERILDETIKKLTERFGGSRRLQ